MSFNLYGPQTLILTTIGIINLLLTNSFRSPFLKTSELNFLNYMISFENFIL